MNIAVQGFLSKTVLKNVRQEIDEFVDGAEQFDDITMLAIKMKETGR